MILKTINLDGYYAFYEIMTYQEAENGLIMCSDFLRSSSGDNRQRITFDPEKYRKIQLLGNNGPVLRTGVGLIYG